MTLLLENNDTNHGFKLYLAIVTFWSQGCKSSIVISQQNSSLRIWESVGLLRPFLRNFQKRLLTRCYQYSGVSQQMVFDDNLPQKQLWALLPANICYLGCHPAQILQEAKLSEWKDDFNFAKGFFRCLGTNRGNVSPSGAALWWDHQ